MVPVEEDNELGLGEREGLGHPHEADEEELRRGSTMVVCVNIDRHDWSLNLRL